MPSSIIRHFCTPVVPDDWRLETLESVADINKESLNGKTTKDYRFRYIDISAVSKGVVNWGEVAETDFGSSPSRARRVVRQHDILLCTVRPGLQSHAFASWNMSEPVICSTGFAVVRLKDGTDPRFIYHLIFSDLISAQLHRLECGTGYPAVNEGDVRFLQIPCPERSEQQAIARILDAVDVSIEWTRTAIATAEKLKRGLMQQALKRCSKAKSPVERLDKLAEIGSGVTLGKDLTGSATIDLPYLRVANVQDGFLDLKEIKTVKIKPTEIEKYQLAEGDVLLTEGGDIDKLGRGAVWAGEIAPCLHQNHIFRVRADRTKLDPHFLATLIGSEYGKRFFLRIAKRTTNLASINKTQLSSFPVIVPKLDEQEAIVNLLAGVDRIIKGHERAHRELEKLKRGLMQDLLTGRVRIKLPAPSGNGVARSRT